MIEIISFYLIILEESDFQLARQQGLGAQEG